MTAPVRRVSVPSAVGENRERIRILEATPPPRLPACRMSVRVDTATIPTGTTYYPPWQADGLYKSSDGDDWTWQTRSHPFSGNFFRFDDVGQSPLQVHGPGLFLARSNWTFGFTGDTVSNAFNIQMVMLDEYANADADGTNGPVLLDGFIAGPDYGINAGVIDARGWGTDEMIVNPYPAGTSVWLGGLPRAGLRCEALFGLGSDQDFTSMFLSFVVLHTFGSDLPFVSYFNMTVTRVGEFGITA